MIAAGAEIESDAVAAAAATLIVVQIRSALDGENLDFPTRLCAAARLLATLALACYPHTTNKMTADRAESQPPRACCCFETDRWPHCPCQSTHRRTRPTVRYARHSATTVATRSKRALKDEVRLPRGWARVAVPERAQESCHRCSMGFDSTHCEATTTNRETACIYCGEGRKNGCMHPSVNTCIFNKKRK